MNKTYLIALMLILLALFSCVPKAPASTLSQPGDSTPTSSTTPESTPRISPSERVPRITKEELLQKIENNADILIVDSRIDVEKQFDAGHIKGAIPVPLAEITDGQWLPPVGKEIIFYCS
jgi:3-mercaptopyruvate sulfurtransferase SseA